MQENYLEKIWYICPGCGGAVSEKRVANKKIFCCAGHYRDFVGRGGGAKKVVRYLESVTFPLWLGPSKRVPMPDLTPYPFADACIEKVTELDKRLSRSKRIRDQRLDDIGAAKRHAKLEERAAEFKKRQEKRHMNEKD